METNLPNHLQKISPTIHSLTVGMTLGLSTLYFGQGCAGTGLCPSCGACALQLPFFLLPVLADGGFVLTKKALSGVRPSGPVQNVPDGKEQCSKE